ncbi:hydroxymethylglutaryl-CoA reductase, degradative [Nocardiopsis nanhaiensis]
MLHTSRLSGFRALGVRERRDKLVSASGLDEAALDALDPGSLSVDAANGMIENVVGVMGVPVGVATNFTVNGQDVLVPMATEEPSVVAAASNAARIARVRGGFCTSGTGPVMQAQIQVVDVADPAGARLRVLEAREELVALANAQDPRLVEVGGGALDLNVRTVPALDETYVVAHLVVDVRDAMGANAVNTMAEAVAPRLAAIIGGRSVLRILTNKADLRISRARTILDTEALGGETIATDIIHAYRLAAADPYRAATHNKGIMNGVSAVVLATGNDTRAVEAGAHSHAVNAEGRYTSLSTFERDREGNVVATLELPTPVGLVGGATRTHPAAQAALALTGVENAVELGEVVAAAGLAQNIAAVRALAGEGIQRGHMALHARNVAVAAGARGQEVDRVVAKLIEERAIRQDRAESVLGQMRGRG